MHRSFCHTDNNEITRYCRSVFGNNPSHAIATYGMRRTVKDVEHTYWTDVTQCKWKKIVEALATLKYLDCKIYYTIFDYVLKNKSVGKIFTIWGIRLLNQWVFEQRNRWIVDQYKLIYHHLMEECYELIPNISIW